ncbi:unnamed protein product [Ectocarpus sp. 12 AP-2014]
MPKARCEQSGAGLAFTCVKSNVSRLLAWSVRLFCVHSTLLYSLRLGQRLCAPLGVSLDVGRCGLCRACTESVEKRSVAIEMMIVNLHCVRVLIVGTLPGEVGGVETVRA